MTRIVTPTAPSVSCAVAVLAPTLALVLAPGVPTAAADPSDESALTIADLAAYREALSGKGATAVPPAPVGFRALWEHPEVYRGRRVQVRGRLVRRFRQGPFGTFPALEEAWVVSPAGDPLCLVFPATATPSSGAATAKAKAPDPTSGQVRFAGKFLKVVKYQGGDGPRLAPLIVGPAPPSAIATATDREPRPSPTRVPGAGWTRLDWALGLAGALLVVLVLARQHLRRPARPLGRIGEDTPAPTFDDANPPRRPQSRDL
jgi:hypothetical protein